MCWRTLAVSGHTPDCTGERRERNLALLVERVPSMTMISVQTKKLVSLTAIGISVLVLQQPASAQVFSSAQAAGSPQTLLRQFRRRFRPRRLRARRQCAGGSPDSDLDGASDLRASRIMPQVQFVQAAPTPVQTLQFVQAAGTRPDSTNGAGRHPSRQYKWCRPRRHPSRQYRWCRPRRHPSRQYKWCRPRRFRYRPLRHQSNWCRPSRPRQYRSSW